MRKLELVMADHQRFELFADLLVRRFPEAKRVYDVAGGMGKLNEALGSRGRECLSFDRRRKHLDVPFAEREFTLDEPCAADLVRIGRTNGVRTCHDPSSRRSS